MRVRIGDVSLFFDVEGSEFSPEGPTLRRKPTILCLHGGPGLDHSPFRPHFSALTDVAQIIYLDQRGHGRSDWSGSDNWSLQQWASDIDAFLDVLSIEKPILLGSSFGGYVAMKHAILFPERLSKLVLISTAARGTGHPVRREHVLNGFARRGGERARDAVRAVFELRTPEAYETFQRVCGPLYNRTTPSADETKRILRNPAVLPYFERADGEGCVFDLSDDLARIQCETLVLGGEDDPITPIGEQAHIVDCMAPGRTRLIQFPECGHGILRDDPAGMIAAIREFVAPKS